MHELSIASAVVATAVRHAGGRRVTAVRVRVGALRQVVPDSLEFCFGIVARDTVCDGARLEVDAVAARLRCTPCDREWQIDVPAFCCPSCGGGDVAVVCGDELLVDSLDVEDEPPPDQAPRGTARMSDRAKSASRSGV